jgi:hypothetical protein
MMLNGSSCDLELLPLADNAGEYTNVKESGVEKVRFDVTGKAFKYKGLNPNCGFSEGNMTLSGSWMISAIGEGLRIGHKPDVGVFFTAGAPGSFGAEEYPVPVSGSHTTQHTLTLGPNSIKCGTSSWTGDLESSTQNLEVDPSYGGYKACAATKLGVVFPATISVQECTFGLSAAKTMSIGCGEEAMEVRVYASKSQGEGLICQYSIGSQENAGELELGTVGSGVDRGISVGLNLKNIAWSLVYASNELLCKGSAKGTMTGSTTLYGPQS